MNEYYIVARKDGEEGPFVYVKCTSPAPWDNRRVFSKPFEAVTLERAEHVQRVLQENKYEAHIVSDKGLINFTFMDLSDLVKNEL